MLKMFTTPTLVQRYLVDPITYRFTKDLKKIYPNPVFAEDFDCILLQKDARVVDSLRKVMKSYKGFKCRRSGDSYVWYHQMKPTANYSGNMLVISLTDNGGLYRFSTHIVMGKKKHNSYALTPFGVLAGLSFFMLLGFGGSYELDLLTTSEFLIRAAICLGCAGLFGFIESRLNPCFSSEEAN